MNFSSFPLYLVLLFSISLNLLLSSGISDKPASVFASSEMQIVYTDNPPNEEPKAYQIRTLASVFGSEEAARKALLYSFKSSINGFAAKLTPDQVKKISKLPGVLHVVQSLNYELQSKGQTLA